jgi:hypothetical protein
VATTAMESGTIAKLARRRTLDVNFMMWTSVVERPFGDGEDLPQQCKTKKLYTQPGTPGQQLF